MILFPGSKIKLGLHVLRRRADGYHDISTLMIPIGWSDVLEIVPAAGTATTLTLYGPHGTGLSNGEDNLVLKALRALEDAISAALPPIDIYLSKNVPTGAGLGGGSADAAALIVGVNELFSLGLSDDALAAVAVKVGADCPFFIYNRPMLAEGIGEVLTPVELPLNGRYVLVVKADEGVSTREAYAGVHRRERDPHERLSADAVARFDKDILVNDFEASVFAQRPAIAALKELLAGTGALYTSMSGSGASVFAIYDSDKMADNARQLVLASRPGADIYCGRLDC
ncbi:MAG: 4-(cytidine 5'-diphospho)-2-C-methyl-D-erythritol kinase [Muribaculaceae bacterium]|nr:4-(cytidine 5'-diphospho)-2-C-methyl-D-erythritol kinase [Muribaculaceae bacterium]